MSPFLAAQQVFTPGSLPDALQFLSDHPGENWRPIAGGTDVMVELYRDRIGGPSWLNLGRLRSTLARICRDGELVRIGALATMTEMRRSALLAQTSPLIGAGAAAVGAPQIQNRATIGGNIVNNSPAGDTLPIWLALDAEVELASVRGLRIMPYDQFVRGYRQTALEPDELLTAVLLRPRPGRTRRVHFRKVATRRAQGISKVVFAAAAEVDGERLHSVRLAFGSMGPVVLRARSAESQIEGQSPAADAVEQAVGALANDLSPIDDFRSTADYRWRVARNLSRAFLLGQIGDLVHERPMSD